MVYYGDSPLLPPRAQVVNTAYSFTAAVGWLVGWFIEPDGLPIHLAPKRSVLRCLAAVPQRSFAFCVLRSRSFAFCV